MLQSLTTLLFVAAALVATGLISALVAQDWESVRRALGLGRAEAFTPLPPRMRLVATRHVPSLRVSAGEMRRAA